MAVNLEMSVQLEAPNYQNVNMPAKKPPPSPATDTQHRGAFRLAGVCIGLMCIIQATLNIVLRLFLTSPAAVEMLPTSCYNHTLFAYTAQLQSRYDDLAKEKNQLNSNLNILLNVRDQLQKEKDKLQSKLFNIAEDLKMPGWISFRSSLYYMSTEKKNWIQSREDCKRRGADLVIIKSNEKQDFIEMLRRGKQAWIGLSDRATEGMWKWVDSSPLTNNYWWNLEPNNYKGAEDCAVTGYIPVDGRPVISVQNTWNDDSCTVSSYWICEKKISV